MTRRSKKDDPDVTTLEGGLDALDHVHAAILALGTAAGLEHADEAGLTTAAGDRRPLASLIVGDEDEADPERGGMALDVRLTLSLDAEQAEALAFQLLREVRDVAGSKEELEIDVDGRLLLPALAARDVKRASRARMNPAGGQSGRTRPAAAPSTKTARREGASARVRLGPARLPTPNLGARESLGGEPALRQAAGAIVRAACELARCPHDEAEPIGPEARWCRGCGAVHLGHLSSGWFVPSRAAVLHHSLGALALSPAAARLDAWIRDRAPGEPQATLSDACGVWGTAAVLELVQADLVAVDELGQLSKDTRTHSFLSNPPNTEGGIPHHDR
jgi:hypothetical protein